MFQRLIFILVIIYSFFGCSGNENEGNSEIVFSLEDEEGLTTALNTSDFTVVCGLFFKVNDFDIWQAQYQKNAKNLIIHLRSSDDPNLVVVFEGNRSNQEAENRVNDMMENVFADDTNLSSSPVISYYEVKYFQSLAIKDKYYLALSFTTKDSGKWNSLPEDRVKQFAKYGLNPVGMGANHDNPSDIYILFSLDDHGRFREENSSPREIHKFIAEFNLPDNTVLSFWDKP